MGINVPQNVGKDVACHAGALATSDERRNFTSHVSTDWPKRVYLVETNTVVLTMCFQSPNCRAPWLKATNHIWSQDGFVLGIQLENNGAAIRRAICSLNYKGSKVVV